MDNALHSVYEEWTTEELLKLHSAGSLTEDGYEVLEEILRERSVSVPKRPGNTNSSSSTQRSTSASRKYTRSFYLAVALSVGLAPVFISMSSIAEHALSMMAFTIPYLECALLTWLILAARVRLSIPTLLRVFTPVLIFGLWSNTIIALAVGTRLPWPLLLANPMTLLAIIFMVCAIIYYVISTCWFEVSDPDVDD